MNNITIYALSAVAGKSGVAVFIRSQCLAGSAPFDRALDIARIHYALQLIFYRSA